MRPVAICPYCTASKVVNMPHYETKLKACQSCGRAWSSTCPTCESKEIRGFTIERSGSPSGMPLEKTTTWHCAECGESWVADNENPVLVYVTVVGVYRDLARMSGDFEDQTFCVLGFGSDTEAAIRDALKRELRGGDFDISDLEVLAVFGGWRERLASNSVSAILQALEAAQEEEEDAG